MNQSTNQCYSDGDVGQCNGLHPFLSGLAHFSALKIQAQVDSVLFADLTLFEIQNSKPSIRLLV